MGSHQNRNAAALDSFFTQREAFFKSLPALLTSKATPIHLPLSQSTSPQPPPSKTGKAVDGGGFPSTTT
ncbi:MAG: hypothetical protein KIH09_17345 [Candidatus Freyarchaeota archaeon]|nr:hypothetical protein [Candidatus Jordarchaeia archaeon]